MFEFSHDNAAIVLEAMDTYDATKLNADDQVKFAKLREELANFVYGNDDRFDV